MMIPRHVLDGIVDGSVTALFRRWAAPRVKHGTRMRTAVGVLRVESVTTVDPATLTERDARQAGERGLAELLARMRDRPGEVYRVELRYLGEDPRIALRESADLAGTELDAVLARLARFDTASRHGAWTRDTLDLIAANPGVRAADLAESAGRPTAPFKIDVRKLKELGLTESLETGYRISARGKTVLAELTAGTA